MLVLLGSLYQQQDFQPQVLLAFAKVWVYEHEQAMWILEF